MSRVVTQFDIDLAQLKLKSEQIKLEMRQMAQQAKETRLGDNLFSGMASKLAALAGGGIVGGAIKNLFNQVDDLADTAVALGETPEVLQRVAMAAKLSGSSIDGLANGMLKLERSLGDVENAKGREALERYGLTAEHLMSLPLDQKIIALASAFQRARQDGTGLADLQALMGRRSGELIPLLSATGDELRAMFEGTSTLSNETVFAMAALNDQFDQLVTNAATGAKQATLELVKLVQAAAAGAEALSGRTLGIGNPDALHDLRDEWDNIQKASEKKVADMKNTREMRAAGLQEKLNQSGEDATQKRIDALQTEIERQRVEALPPKQRVEAIGWQLKAMLRSANPTDPTLSGLDMALAGATGLKEKERLLQIKKKAQDAQKDLADLAPKEKTAETQYQQLGAFGKAAAFFSGQNPNELIAVEAQKQTQSLADNNKLLSDIKTVLEQIRGKDGKLIVNDARFTT